MMVTFVSQCQKKALNRTRRVLDAFANRIGDNTWQTVITEDGLVAVKKLLRKTATKNTAVSCHWIRSRSRSDLVWIVGNRSQFNHEGVVPVNTTQKDISASLWENTWDYLPTIKALVAVAALLHDWGKASVLFQNKLCKGGKEGDPLRHEWISCLLLNALVQQANHTDEGWLTLLAKNDWKEEQLKQEVAKNTAKPLANLPPIAQLVAWLIVSHHRLPFQQDKGRHADTKKDNLANMLKSVSADWGYQNEQRKQSQEQCFKFSEGVLSQSLVWNKTLQKWASRLLEAQSQIQTLLDNGAYRIVLHHARLCLMLGDHYYSSQEADKNWQTSIHLFANTDNKNELKQKLDEHLVGVCEQALRISQNLSRFTTDMEAARNIRSLKQRSPPEYRWQDIAIEKITLFKKQHPSLDKQNYGWFVVNMASTGCGKTIANAKVMQALSTDADSLRFILALGLRTLTLQTGDEYRQRIGLDSDELAVLIGSTAVQELHKHNKNTHTEQDKERTFEELGSESLEFLLDEDLDYTESPTADFLNATLRCAKDKAFLYKPVLVCTIDHIMAATETLRGGRYILPCLRLLSSDLVIDEVDDFDGKDLVAIARLIHLAGMLGRKVMISSATIPPALAEGFFNAYQAGWRLHRQFLPASALIACTWVDEFNTHTTLLKQPDSLEICTQYQKEHQDFVSKRVVQLQTQAVRRKAYIVPCDELLADESKKQSRQQGYFSIIQQTALDLHHQHHTVDAKTGKCVSFGVVRMANIPPCVALSQFLLEGDWQAPATARIMCYHSRQVLLLRSEQECHLDEVLKRKEQPDQAPQAFDNPQIRHHLDNSPAQHVLFIVVATPVEEVGRDHDFDWAIIEPSSYRSIIQMAGRVHRHRKTQVAEANIAIMQYNLKALRQDKRPVFCRPGYELNSLKLSTHNLYALIDTEAIHTSVNAIPRIQAPPQLQATKQLADLEHQVMMNTLTNYDKQGPNYLQAWLNEAWWLTALPQQFNRFRDSAPDKTLYLVWRDGEAKFNERNEKGEFIERQRMNNIDIMQKETYERLWLNRNYASSLSKMVKEDQELDYEQAMKRYSKRYGEITKPDDDKNKKYIYSDQFGLYPARS